MLDFRFQAKDGLLFMSENKKSRGGNTAAVVTGIAQPVAESLGLSLWDVQFKKEGSSWFLRLIIDKPGGVFIDDCEKLSRAVDKLLDEADPIEQSYFLEVSSPGIARELTRQEHYEKMTGNPVVVRLIRPRDGIREFSGELKGLIDGHVVIIKDGQALSFAKAEIAKVNIDDDFGGDLE